MRTSPKGSCPHPSDTQASVSLTCGSCLAISLLVTGAHTQLSGATAQGLPPRQPRSTRAVLWVRGSQPQTSHFPPSKFSSEQGVDMLTFWKLFQLIYAVVKVNYLIFLWWILIHKQSSTAPPSGETARCVGAGELSGRWLLTIASHYTVDTLSPRSEALLFFYSIHKPDGNGLHASF